MRAFPHWFSAFAALSAMLLSGCHVPPELLPAEPQPAGAWTTKDGLNVTLQAGDAVVEPGNRTLFRFAVRNVNASMDVSYARGGCGAAWTFEVQNASGEVPIERGSEACTEPVQDVALDQGQNVSGHREWNGLLWDGGRWVDAPEGHYVAVLTFQYKWGDAEEARDVRVLMPIEVRDADSTPSPASS